MGTTLKAILYVRGCQFTILSVDLLSDSTRTGRFQIQIPDFSRDRVAIQMQDGFLEVLVVERSTGKIVEPVLPSADLQYERVGLKILPSYDSEIGFVARR
jgi:hypothetical protein